ncbi:CHAD domain-containing protein [Microvirga sp. 2MCAF38]|uniref:CYTH and CHAD domain-containing protein n=1 Tax=Microvirga sp. 2MCAF38 TaxID=3232989 RepID=UPI003F9AB0D3
MNKVEHPEKAIPDRAKLAREIELKLEFAPHDIHRILRHPILTEAKALPERGGHLHAVYYDTPNHALRRAGLSLRVRHENGRFIQTIKAEQKSHSLALDRAEWECAVDGAFDPAAAAGTPLTRFLSDPSAKDKIRPLFTVETDRRAFLIARDGSRIEIAIDMARASCGKHKENFAEIELELKRGEPTTLFAIAREIAKAVPLRLSLVTKSERAYALSKKSALKPSHARPVALPHYLASAEAFQVIARSCLFQIVRNDAVLQRNRAPEAVHQLRVGIRRLRAATSIFKDQLRDRESRACRLELRWMAKQLNPARDIDVLLGNLRHAHARQRDLREIEARRKETYIALFEVLAARRFKKALLALAAWIETGAWLTRDKRKARAQRFMRVEQRAAEDLSRRWKRISKRVTRVEDLNPDQHHKLRIRIKALRYGTEFFASLFDVPTIKRRRKAFLAQLEVLQDALGEINDQAIAKSLAPDIKSVNKGAKQQRRKLLSKAASAADKLSKVKPFWE